MAGVSGAKSSAEAAEDTAVAVLILHAMKRGGGEIERRLPKAPPQRRLHKGLAATQV